MRILIEGSPLLEKLSSDPAAASARAKLIAGGVAKERAGRLVDRVVMAFALRFGEQYIPEMTGHLEEIGRLRGTIEGKWSTLLAKLRDPGFRVKSYEGELTEIDRLADQLEEHMEAVADRTPMKAAQDFAEKLDPDAVLADAQKAEAEPTAPATTARQEVWLSRLHQIVAKSTPGQTALQRLIDGRRWALIRDVIEDYGDYPEHAKRILRKLGRLSPEQIEALDLIRTSDEREPGMGLGGPNDWFDVLNLPRESYLKPMLDLVYELRGVVKHGLAEVVGRGLRANKYDPQGLLGHLYAARTLATRYPGCTMLFEVAEGTREIDIQMSWNGRTFDVEVKTPGPPGPYETPHPTTWQKAKDLARHIGDPNGPWTDLLWLYPDEQAPNIDLLRGEFREAFNDPIVQSAIKEKGMDRLSAELELERRLKAGLITTFHF